LSLPSTDYPRYTELGDCFIRTTNYTGRRNSIQVLQEDYVRCDQVLARGEQLNREWDNLHKGTIGVLNLDSIMRLTASRKISFSSLVYNDCQERISWVLSDEPRDINVYIPTSFDRKENLIFCCESLRKAAQSSYSSIRIIVLEGSDSPHLKNLSLSICGDYIHFPQFILNFTGNVGLYPKAVIQNLGFLLTQSAAWNIFHDTDIVVPPNFFILFQKLIDDRRGMLSWAILYNALVRLQTMPNNLTSITNIPGKTTRTEIGGSVAVTIHAFQEVGGYDSECFYGYSHEDRMFKLKLSTIHPMVQMNVTLHHVPHAEQVIHHSKLGSAVSNYLHLHKSGVIPYIASTRNRLPQFLVCW